MQVTARKINPNQSLYAVRFYETISTFGTAGEYSITLLSGQNYPKSGVITDIVLSYEDSRRTAEDFAFQILKTSSQTYQNCMTSAATLAPIENRDSMIFFDTFIGGNTSGPVSMKSKKLSLSLIWDKNDQIILNLQNLNLAAPANPQTFYIVFSCIFNY